MLNADNYLDYIKSLLIKSAQRAKDAGADIPDNIGIKTNANNSRRQQSGDCITDIDMTSYLT